jgi:hypothetical protein
MALRKVTFFDHPGQALESVEDDGQARPCVFGVRWVNPDTFETIRARGGRRTGPNGETIMEIAPTSHLGAFEPGKGPIEIERLAGVPAGLAKTPDGIDK